MEIGREKRGEEMEREEMGRGDGDRGGEGRWRKKRWGEERGEVMERGECAEHEEWEIWDPVSCGEMQD